jgi:hypothetical protein
MDLESLYAGKCFWMGFVGTDGRCSPTRLPHVTTAFVKVAEGAVTIDD